MRIHEIVILNRRPNAHLHLLGISGRGETKRKRYRIEEKLVYEKGREAVNSNGSLLHGAAPAPYYFRRNSCLSAAPPCRLFFLFFLFFFFFFFFFWFSLPFAAAVEAVCFGGADLQLSVNCLHSG